MSGPGFATAVARPHPGDGLVLRRGGVLAVAAAGGHPATTDALARICLEVGESGGDGRRLARRLAGFLTDDPPDVPAFAALGVRDETLVVFVHGDAEVAVGAKVISGRESPTWVDRLLPWPVHRLCATLPAAGAAASAPIHLRDGVVAGAGVTLEVGPDQEPTPADGAAQSERDGDPIETDEMEIAEVETAGPPAFESIILWSEDPAQPPPPAPAAPGPPEDGAQPDQLPETRPSQPLPQSVEGEQDVGDGVVVRGVLCKNEHLNDPRMLFCGVCGINMVQQTPVLTEGRRPPLGVLVLDDGSVFQLDTDYVLGREPEHDDGVRSGRYRSIKLSDTDKTLSRAHARIELRHWDVVIVDNGSANGTHVCEGERPWTALAAGAPHLLQPGARVRMGARTLVYNTHRAV